MLSSQRWLERSICCLCQLSPAISVLDAILSGRKNSIVVSFPFPDVLHMKSLHNLFTMPFTKNSVLVKQIRLGIVSGLTKFDEKVEESCPG